MRNSRYIPTLCVLIAVVFGSIWTAPSVLGQGVGDPAPNFTYGTLDGRQVSLSNHTGQVVFIFFFGYACPFCLAVGSRTETEVNQVFSSNSAFQAIGLDLWNGSSAGVNGFRQQTGITYPLCLQAGPAGSLFRTTYDRVMVIDGSGIIRYKGGSAVSGTLNAAKAVISDLLGSSTGVEDDIPGDYELLQNYPNPFNPATSITFSVPVGQRVTLRIYDTLGREVRTLVDDVTAAGRNTISWDGRDAANRSLPSGVYLYRLQTATFSKSRVMTLLG